MSFLYNGIAFLLGAYLALINAAAHEIIAVLPSSEEGAPLASAGVGLTPLPGTPKEAIPDILLRNADYQRAAVAESMDPSEARSTALEALVNIYCSYTSGNFTKTTTGTGFIIDTNGVILTNAHVAQFLLLEGIVGSAQCIIRTGDPATPMYEAELLYIPPAWIREHANLINEMTPKGTGERDYALLYINAALDRKPMPSRFAALPFDTDLLPTSVLGNEVFATGYPAEALIENGTDAPLLPKQASTSIAELMTFGSDYVDLFTIRGSDIGEHGSSGGPVVDTDGKAIGIISTKGDDEKFGKGSLRAVSLSYIDRTIKEETGFSLVQNLGGDLPYRAALFKKTMIPFLQQIMEGTL